VKDNEMKVDVADVADVAAVAAKSIVTEETHKF
jgi:hypothetical protein